MNIAPLIQNVENIGIYIGIVREIADNKVVIRTLLENLVQFEASVFSDGASINDRVVITKCFKTGKVNGVILPPIDWNN